MLVVHLKGEIQRNPALVNKSPRANRSQTYRRLTPLKLTPRLRNKHNRAPLH